MRELLKILLIDSDFDALSKYGDFLNKSGFSTFTATKKEDILSEIEKIAPVIILIDSQVRDALQLCGIIKEMPDLKNSMIILVFDENSPVQFIENAINEGADDFLFKPFSEVALLARITASARILKLVFLHQLTFRN